MKMGPKLVRIRSFLSPASMSPAVLLMAATLVSSGLGVLSGSFQAHLLGPADRGELAMAMTPGIILAILLCFGLPEYLTRATARGLDPRLLSTVALTAACGTGIVFLLPYVWLASSVLDLPVEVWILLVAFGATLPLYVYGYSLLAITAGSGAWRMVAGIRVFPPLASVLGLGLLLLIGESADLVLVVGLFLLTVAAAGPIFLLVNPRVRPRRVSPQHLRGNLLEAYEFGLRSWSSGSIAFLNQRVDLLLVTGLASAVDIGFYAVSVSLTAVVTAAVNAAITPMKNRVATQGLAGIERYSLRVFWCVAGLVGVVVMLLPWFIDVVLGSSFAPSRAVMSLLMVGQIPLAIVIVLTQSVISAGKPAAPLPGEVVALIATVVFTVCLFDRLGIFAAALGGIIGTLCSAIWLMVLYRRYTGAAPVWLIVPRRVQYR